MKKEKINRHQRNTEEQFTALPRVLFFDAGSALS
jgi:hypothetical protein